MIRKLSILIPAYNEESTIYEVLEKVDQLPLVRGVDKEIVVINDYSSDHTQEQVEQFIVKYPNSPVRLFNQDKNKGKGAAIQLGIKKSEGDFLIPQDADLELNPEDINRLIEKAVDNELDVVYGNRFHSGNSLRKNASYYANQLLSALMKLKTGLQINDMECGYKLIRSSLIKPINLRENRFGFEPEITAKLAKIKGIKIGEVPIFYKGRTYDEGKKINWTDGLKALFCILKY